MIRKFFAKLSEREKKIMYFAGTVLFCTLFDFCFLGPVQSKMKSLNEEIATKENSLKRDLRFLSYKDKILQEKKSLNKYYTTRPRTEEETIAAFLKKIEMLASKAQINLIRVSPTEGAEKQGRKEYLANLECNGKLKDIVSFMYMIDSSEDLLKIVKLSMNAKKSSPDEISASMMINKIIVKAVASDPEAGKIPRPVE